MRNAANQKNRLEFRPALVQHDSVKVLGIIPARFGATRFPGKALASIAGKPLIQHVVERAQKAKGLDEVIVATDDPRIVEVTQRFCRTEMTASEHPSGTDRIAEVARRDPGSAVVNIQGDEPLLDPRVIDAVVDALGTAEMATAATPIRNEEEYSSPNCVKVVVDSRKRALYFSRRPIPFLRDWQEAPASEQWTRYPFRKHIGIYGYRSETLQRLVSFPMSPLEQAERLEQLRALENGVEIRVVEVDYESVGVDVPEDVRRVEEILRA